MHVWKIFSERTNSIKKKKGSGPAEYNQVYEINYEPEDESIHIEQAASKTNFIRRRKNIWVVI